MKKVLVDLHTHTNLTDGYYSPLELYKIIKQIVGDKQVVWSVTDHDSADAYEVLNQIKDEKVKIVNGCEFSFLYKGKLKDMLAYNIDINKTKQFLKEFYTPEFKFNRQVATLEAYKEMCLKHNLKFENDLKIIEGKAGEGYNVMTQSLKKFKENERICPDLFKVGFYRKHFVNKNSPFFVKEEVDLPSLEEIIYLIHSFGGIAFIAHPFDYGGETIDDVLEFLKDAKKARVDGIEVFHYSVNEEKINLLRNFIKRNNLLESGGTDFHGDKIKKEVCLFTGKENNVKIDINKLTWIKI